MSHKLYEIISDACSNILSRSFIVNLKLIISLLVILDLIIVFNPFPPLQLYFLIYSIKRYYFH